MKKMVIIFLTAFVLIMSAFTLQKHFASGVHGIISPADGATQVWAVANKDSVSAVPMTGNFSIDLKPGNWKLHVVTVSPYKDVFIENVLVEEGKYTDVGEIKLKGVTK